MSTATFARCSFLMLASLGLFSSCKKVCDNEDAPVFPLTQGQQQWGNAYVKNAVWRFQNAGGYVRTYRVTRSETISEGGGGGKGSLCATYYNNFFVADLERTDSVGTLFRFQMSPANSTANASFKAYVQLNGNDFTPLPIDQVEDGRLTLAPATFGSRTYPAVLESTYTPNPPPVPRPTSARRIYLTKAEGVVRFEEFGGTVWNRQ